MNIILFIVFAIVFTSLVAVIAATPIDNSSVNASETDTLVSVKRIQADYIGGMSNILERTKCTLILMKDKINFRIEYKNTDLFIDFDKIAAVKIQSGIELSSFGSDVYISKKHKATSDSRYLVISYYNSSYKEMQNLIFECSSYLSFIKKYEEVLNAWNLKNSADTCTFDYDTNSLVCSLS